MLNHCKRQQRQMPHESDPGNTSVAKMAPRAPKILGSERNPAVCCFLNQTKSQKGMEAHIPTTNVAQVGEGKAEGVTRPAREGHYSNTTLLYPQK